MADTVQVFMEKMIPELEDLQQKKLFNPDEIQQIVERRREFEYMMKRIPLRKIDALRYIEYELNLDALRAKRKERAGLEKMSLSDFAGVRRVHSIFERVIYKHRGSIDLWLQYIEYCKNEGSSKILSHVFSRALQVHPRCAEIWIEAASYEFSTNLNVDSARILMQRAIRINKNCQRLWHEYFRLEMLYIQKLAVRREVLKLDGDEAKPVDAEASVLLEELPEEKNVDEPETDEMREQTEKFKLRAEILKGAIPRIVFKNAIATIADDVAFRLKFLEISDLFGRRFAADLSQFVLDSCVADFPEDAEVHAAQALRPFVLLDDQEHAQAEKQAFKKFELSVKQLGTAAIKEKFVEWMVARLSSGFKTQYLEDCASQTLKQLATSAPLSLTVCKVFADFLLRTEGPDQAIAAAHEIATGPGAKLAELWVLCAQLTLQATPGKAQRAPKRRRVEESKTSPLAEAVSVLEEGLKALDSADKAGKYLIWQHILDIKAVDSTVSTSELERMFVKAMASQTLDSDAWHSLREKYISWAMASQPLAHVRQIYKKFMDGPMLPTAASRSFLMLCIDVETSALESDISIDQVRLLFEKLVDLFGSADDDVWVKYIRVFSTRGLFAEANKIHHRALRTCKDSVRLSQLELTAGTI
ncbi:TPA: hypothetical protein N0F65_000429 [Lagenidium giganteum]|uniref:U3 small nucleolar RNA-associated protein 6 n=2 Tax=Lagenidium giganteum TaxID=4803 RepID=A0AAV2YHY8_9STRA|nr:TPA: hypothetical protein N0F65_000429 [Lagenidium giganteum]